MAEFLHKEITEKIIGAAFEVHRILGYGFLESVYRNALQIELIAQGFTAVTERKIDVHY